MSTSTFAGLTDPRLKTRQGLDRWAEALLARGLISGKVFFDFVCQNNSKEKQMERGGFPQLKHYGLFPSSREIRENLSHLDGRRFIPRCRLRGTYEIKRMLDASLDETCDFVDRLPGGAAVWEIEVKEFVETVATGTIIVDSLARTTIETWGGAHFLNTTNVPRCHGEFDPWKFHSGFNWGDVAHAQGQFRDLRECAVEALRYVFPHLKPREHEPIYLEYAVRPSGQVYFIEANSSSLLTDPRFNLCV